MLQTNSTTTLDANQSAALPLVAMLGSKLMHFESFFMLHSRMLYHCKGLDKRYYEKCEKMANEYRGHFSVSVFDVMWMESGYKDQVFDFRYAKMFDEFNMGLLFENSGKVKSLMKISLMSDGHIVVCDLETYQYATDPVDYIKTLRQYVLVAKMSGKHVMILVNMSRYDPEMLKLNDLMEGIQNILHEFTMSNVKIIGVKGDCNFSSLNQFETLPHPLFSKLTLQEAILELRKEIIQDKEMFNTTEINEEKDNLVFAIMGKYKIGGVGNTMIGKVLSGSIQVDQELIISEPTISNVKSLEIFHVNQTIVRRGDFCGVALKHVSMNELTRGTLIGIAPCHTFEAIIYITQAPQRGWKVGATPTVYSNCGGQPCRVIEIVERLSKKTRETLVSNPPNCKEKDLVRLRFSCTKGIYLFTGKERWKRIILLHNNQIIGGGIITSSILQVTPSLNNEQ